MASGGPALEPLVDRQYSKSTSHTISSLPYLFFFLMLSPASAEVISVITNDGRNIVVSKAPQSLAAVPYGACDY